MQHCPAPTAAPLRKPFSCASLHMSGNAAPRRTVTTTFSVPPEAAAKYTARLLEAGLSAAAMCSSDIPSTSAAPRSSATLPRTTSGDSRMTRLQKMTLIMLMKRFTASHANMLSGTSNAFSLRAFQRACSTSRSSRTAPATASMPSPSPAAPLIASVTCLTDAVSQFTPETLSPSLISSMNLSTASMSGSRSAFSASFRASTRSLELSESNLWVHVKTSSFVSPLMAAITLAAPPAAAVDRRAESGSSRTRGDAAHRSRESWETGAT
mmetsp:Transcript_15885/g.49929  ORF Transcript_15885/g.49929 Transcript_15885/m.49929 type:complete len:267 (-) Transcript_15885:668-1468(-)